MLTIKMTAVEQRREMVEALKKDLGLKDDDIIWDDRPGGGNAMYTVKKAWLSPLKEGETHRLVMSEDLEVCENFKEICEQMIAAHPGSCFTLFTTALNSRCYDEYLSSLTTPYIDHRIGIFGCAILLPVQYIQECFDWIEANCSPDIWDNIGIRRWLEHKGLEILTTVPCLIQHIGDESVVDPTFPVRRSDRFVEKAAADWSSKAVAKFPELEWFKPFDCVTVKVKL